MEERPGHGAAARGSSSSSGVYPKPVLDRIEPSVDGLVTHVEQHSDYREPARRQARRRRRARRAPGTDRARVASLPSRRGHAHADRPRRVAWSALAPICPRRRGPGAAGRRRLRRHRRTGRRLRACSRCRRRGRARWRWPPAVARRARPPRGPLSTVADAVALDGFSLFVTFVICAAVILGALLADGYLRREELEGPSPTC